MLQAPAEATATTAAQLFSKAQDMFLTVASPLSLPQLLSAFVLALAWIFVRRRARGKGLRVQPFLKTFFASRVFLSRSAKLDYQLAIFNLFIAGVLFGWAVLSHHTISIWTHDALGALFGARPASGQPGLAIAVLTTAALFLAYEFAYWLDHYLAHKTPFLWEFHKVHHQAEALTPITNFRVHPVDSLVFYNILALCTGLTQGLCSHLFGTAPITLSGENIFFLVFAFTTLHLQHSHVWIAFRGVWGRIFLSPAHHQIHHSRNPIHFDRNFGSSLAVFDWLFGTLHVPSASRDAVAFGVDGEGADPHSLAGALVAPFARAAARFQDNDRVQSASADRAPVQ